MKNIKQISTLYNLLDDEIGQFDTWISKNTENTGIHLPV